MIKKIIFYPPILSAIAAAGCISLLAQKIQTDRPSAQTDNASTLYKEAFQIEYGTTFLFENNKLENIAIPNTLYRYGLSENVCIKA